MLKTLFLSAAATAVFGAGALAGPGMAQGGGRGSATAAAERMLGATAARGGAAVRVSRLGGARGGACNNALGGNIYEVVLSQTPTGWEERFLLGVPLYPESNAAPLLVGFHQFEVSHFDLCEHTDFFGEAFSRGWFIVTPLGAAQQSFGGLEAQANTELVLDFCSILPIDRERIFGVGFSTGGGWMTSYAARHRDPTDQRFAALVNHTGGVSLTHTYANELPWDDGCDPPFPGCFGSCGCSQATCDWEVADFLEYFYDGPPTRHPFSYLRCSLFELDPVGGVVIDPETDMAGNLLTTPVRTSYALNDISPVGLYLAAQCLALEAHLTATLGGLQHTLVGLQASQHTWDTLNEADACDYLALNAPAPPAGPSTLTADRDGRWEDMTVTQDQPPAPASGAWQGDWVCGSIESEPGHFTRFDWIVDTPLNRFTLFASERLSSLTLHTADAGLVVGSGLDLSIWHHGGGGDGIPDQLVLMDFATSPTSVKLGNLTMTAGVDYLWDAASQCLILFPRAWPTGNFLNWTIRP